MSSDRTKFGGGRGGLVHVDAYDQQRHGHTVDVRQHYRSWPGGGGWYDGAELGAPFLRFKSIDLGLRTKIEPKPEVLRALGLTLDDFVVREKKPPRLQNFEAGATPVAARTDGHATSPTAPTEPRTAENPARPSTASPNRGLNGKGYVPQPGDETILARLTLAEAAEHLRQNPEFADRIIWAAINRAKNGKTIEQVVMGKNQFATTDDKNSLWKPSEHPETLAPGDRRAYEIALDRAQRILRGEVPDPTGGAEFFITGDEKRDGFHEGLRLRQGFSMEEVTPRGSNKTWRFYTAPKSKTGR